MIIGNHERAEFVEAVVQKHLLPLMKTKGHDYTKATGAQSAVSNFHDVAIQVGMPDRVDKFITWMVFFTKHMQAIRTWLADRQVKSEPLSGRIADAINYLFLLWMMLVEEGVLPDPRVEES